MVKKFNPPPNWPTPPEGWTPPPGWQPDPHWPPPPEGHEFWVDDRGWVRRHKVLTGVLSALLLILLLGLVAPSPDTTAPTASGEGRAIAGADPTSPPVDQQAARA